MPKPTVSEVLSVLRDSHERLAVLLGGVAAQGAAAPSYDAEWTVAQVASHLGSGGEVFVLILDAGLTGAAAPGVERFQPIWDRWNAKAPIQQVRDCVLADAAVLDRVGGLTEQQQAGWRLDLFGTVQDLPGLLRMRLAEHALHTWDIEVAADPTAILPALTAGLILDNLAFLVKRVGGGTAEVVDVDVVTSQPDRRFLLRLDAGGATLTPAGDTGGGRELRAPAESFVRLVYGRLDPDHTPASVTAADGLLDLLRAAFPGV